MACVGKMVSFATVSFLFLIDIWRRFLVIEVPCSWPDDIPFPRLVGEEGTGTWRRQGLPCRSPTIAARDSDPCRRHRPHQDVLLRCDSFELAAAVSRNPPLQR